MREQPTQVTEVGRSLHGAAGKADQQATLTDLVVYEPRVVGTIEGCHAESLETP